MKTNRIETIIQALYKSGKMEICFSDADKEVRKYISDEKFFPVTKNEFLTAIHEYAEYSYHLILGGRKSKNPVFIMYGNSDKKEKCFRKSFK